MALPVGVGLSATAAQASDGITATHGLPVTANLATGAGSRFSPADAGGGALSRSSAGPVGGLRGFTLVDGPETGAPVAGGQVVGSAVEDGAAPVGQAQVLAIQVTPGTPGAPPSVVLAEVQGGPAAAAGLRAGDVLTSIDGIPLVRGGVVDQNVLDRLLPPESGSQTARLTVHRPSTGRTWETTLKLDAPPPGPDGRHAPRTRHVVRPGGPAGAGGADGSLESGSQPLPAPPELPAPPSGSAAAPRGRILFRA